MWPETWGLSLLTQLPFPLILAECLSCTCSWLWGRRQLYMQESQTACAESGAVQAAHVAAGGMMRGELGCLCCATGRGCWAHWLSPLPATCATPSHPAARVWLPLSTVWAASLPPGYAWRAGGTKLPALGGVGCTLGSPFGGGKEEVEAGEGTSTEYGPIICDLNNMSLAARKADAPRLHQGYSTKGLRAGSNPWITGLTPALHAACRLNLVLTVLHVA